MNLPLQQAVVTDHFKRIVSEAVGRSIDDQPLIPPVYEYEPVTITPEVFAGDPHSTNGVVIIGDMFQGTAIATPFVSAMREWTTIRTQPGFAGTVVPFYSTYMFSPFALCHITHPLDCYSVFTSDGTFVSASKQEPYKAEVIANTGVQDLTHGTSLNLYYYSPHIVPDVIESASVNQKAMALIQSWCDDDSGYDVKVWPKIKESLEQNRLSERKLFND